MLTFFLFLSAALLEGGTVAAFQGFKFRFLPALLDLNITVHFAGRLYPYPSWPEASQL